MDILFIGEQRAGYVFDEFAEKNDLTIGYVGNTFTDYFEVKNEVIRIAPKHLVMNIEQTRNNEDELMKAVKEIFNAVNCNIIIMAEGYTKDMRIIQSFISMGINNFMLTSRNIGNSLMK